MPRARPLALSGAMGVGKSTVARILAARAGTPMVDVDTQMEAESGRSVAAIFARDGEAGFRALEVATLARLLRDGTPRVLALGGGAVTHAPTRRLLLSSAIVVTLRARPETLLDRIGESGVRTRPLLAGADDPLASMRALLSTRDVAYGEAHAEVDTEGATPELVAERVDEVWQRDPVVVPMGARTYRVEVHAGARARLAPSLHAMTVRGGRVLVVTDDAVWPNVGARMEDALRGVDVAGRVTLRAGEAHKTVASAESIWDAAIDARLDRNGVIVAIGGGVVGDVAGFAAATLMRGVRVVQVPTTLLAMVEASVGGKTGIDRPQGKNLVGAFHQPSAVVADIELLDTLPTRELRSGMAEVVKTALIGDVILLEALEANAEALIGPDLSQVARVVRAAVAHKARVVSEDERDETGARAALNFGHTVGHALEAECGYASLTHGEAVALGLVAAL